jgi:putative oxidoreductase
VKYAESAGVPAPTFMVPLSGIVAILGGLSIALGYHARFGALLIVLFLIPVTFIMHDFWNETDEMQYRMQMVNFMKNLGLMGGAFILAYFGSGPLSIKSGV